MEISNELPGKVQQRFRIIALKSAAYGIFLVISSISLFTLLRHGRRYSGRRISVVYTTYMLVVVTVWWMLSAFTVSSGRICDPLATLDVEKLCIALEILGGNALLLYRAFVIWDGEKRVMIPLTVLYVISYVTALLSRVLCGHGSIRIVQGTNALFLLASVALNIIAPLPIALKLYASKRALAQSPNLGDTRKRISSTLGVIVVYMTTVVLPAVVVAIVEGVVKDIPEEIGMVFQCLIFLVPALIIFSVSVRVHRDSIRYEAVESVGERISGIECRRSAVFEKPLPIKPGDAA